MYESFYGLRERPFDLTPNPKYLYLTASHREALSTLQYGISGRRGLTVMIGEAGTGKTTLMRTAVEALAARDVLCAYVNNPALTRQEFYELLRSRFGLPADPGGSKAKFLVDVERLVFARHEIGGVSALVIDEAQALPARLLEEVRLLANIETETEKLLPVVLAGQPELAVRLNAPEFRQLKQRVALRCQLSALTLQETAAYIAGRIRIAGGDSSTIFTREAVQLIFERSQGIPRTISVICDNALVSGFALDARPIGSAIVLDVCRDFGLATSVDQAFLVPERPGAQAPHPASHAALPAVAPSVLAPAVVPAPSGQPGGNGTAAMAPAPPANAERGWLFRHFGERRRRFFDFFWNRTGGTT
jgi:general secretion pathway protein A